MKGGGTGRWRGMVEMKKGIRIPPAIISRGNIRRRT